MRDQVIEEIRDRRRKMLQEDFGGSIKKFGEHARQWEKEHPERVVNLHDLKAAEYRKIRFG
jgi:hypothetical protein